MDDSLAKQINRSHDILKAFNVPVYSVEGLKRTMFWERSWK